MQLCAWKYWQGVQDRCAVEPVLLPGVPAHLYRSVRPITVRLERVLRVVPGEAPPLRVLSTRSRVRRLPVGPVGPVPPAFLAPRLRWRAPRHLRRAKRLRGVLPVFAPSAFQAPGLPLLVQSIQNRGGRLPTALPVLVKQACLVLAPLLLVRFRAHHAGRVITRPVAHALPASPAAAQQPGAPAMLDC